MAGLRCIILLLLEIALMAAVPAVTCNRTRGREEMIRWYSELPHRKQKMTELHFYLHDIVSGPNPTNIPIAVANSTRASPTYFGLIAVMDDLLTAGPSPDSEKVGRAKGLFGSASLEEIAYHMTMNLVLGNGTLTLVGHNPFMEEYRELSIVGGSGVYRLAQGTALLNTVKLNSTTGDALVEYNVMVLHY